MVGVVCLPLWLLCQQYMKVMWPDGFPHKHHSEWCLCGNRKRAFRGTAVLSSRLA
jgi:hypothetical protein